MFVRSTSPVIKSPSRRLSAVALEISEILLAVLEASMLGEV
jgi:hypothetical protein